MVHQELVEYISTAINGGVAEPQIIQTLAGVGWAMPDIEEALGVVKGTRQNTDNSFQSVLQRATQQEKSPTASTASPLQTSPQITQSPITSTPSASPTVASPSTIVGATTLLPVGQSAARSKKTLIISLAVVCLIVISAGVGFAYYKGFIGSGSKITYTKGSVLLSASQAIGTMESAKYAVSFQLVAQPRDESTKPFIPTPPTEEELAPYKRDQDRFRLLENAKQSFPRTSSLGTAKKPPLRPALFPHALADVGITSKDPLGNAYDYTQKDGGKDFELRITFETPDAIAVFKQRPSMMYIDEPSSKEPTIENYTVTFNQKSINNYYYFSGRPMAFEIVDAFSNSDELFSSLPSSLNVAFGISGIMSKKADDNRDTYLQGTADVDLGDFIVNADVEFIKKAEDYFVRINKMPTFFFFDFSSIKKQWVQIDLEDETLEFISPRTVQDALTDEFGLFGVNTSTSNTQSSEDAGKNAKDAALMVLSVGEKTGFIGVGDPSSETRNGEKTLRYPIRFEKTKLKAFYTELTKALKDRFGDSAATRYDEQMAKQLEQKNVGELIDYLNNSSAINMWVAQKTGYPIAFEYSTHVAPRATTGPASKKQFRATLSITLSDINKSNAIETPKDAISTEDATILMSGISKETYRFNQQTRNISSIKRALSTYENITGSYPNTLSELTKTGSEILKLHPNPPTDKKPQNIFDDRYYTNRKLLEKVPVDTYTKKPFAYAKDSNNFSLSYTIELPPYERGIRVDYGIMNNDYKKISLKYITGTNTADESVDSREAVSANNQDTDKDGVSDAFEVYMGTDKNKKDTDNDGVDDQKELNSMSNPLGPGRLEYRRSGGGSLLF
jgi:hypothetical protein